MILRIKMDGCTLFVGVKFSGVFYSVALRRRIVGKRIRSDQQYALIVPFLILRTGSYMFRQ
jgi:hypothetical protein